MHRVKTGIPGMDEILHGGIPERNVVLLSGGPGTGKSIFCQQFLFKGVEEYDEPGILIALEEHPVQIRINMEQFGWDVRRYEKEGKFVIIDAFTSGIGSSAKREKYIVRDPSDEMELIDVMKEAIDEIGAISHSALLRRSFKPEGTSTTSSN